MDTVSVQRVDTYNDSALYRAVCAHFEALNIAADLSSDTRVLLKPNLLSGRDPVLAVTTHPAVLRAITRRLCELGVRNIVLADSSGGVFTPASLRRLYAACGLSGLSDVLTLNENAAVGERDGFPLMQAILDADYILNCPKLKTHGLTVMTAGVKNLFGCIPGLKKPEMHCLKPSIDDFVEMLLMLSRAVRPQLTLLDAVDCMEGNGPGGGTVRHMGYTVAARSVYALDEAGAALMALRPGMAPTVRRARQLGWVDPSEIQYVGDTLVPADPPFRMHDAFTNGERTLSVNGLFHRFFGQRHSFPSVRAEKCIGCGRCAESCPHKLINIVEHKAVIRRKGCISCFCCQEMCPAHAIETVRG